MSSQQNTAPDATPDEPAPSRRHPALIATAVALPVALLVGVIVAAVMTGRSAPREPVALGAVPAPKAESAQCTDMIKALPQSLGDYQRAELVQPAPAGAVAWNKDGGGQAITLRCGLDRPDEFVQGSALQLVDGVQWLQVSGKSQGLDASTWYVVDRGVYAALTLPDGSGPTPIQAVSDAIAKALPATPIDPAPAPHN